MNLKIMFFILLVSSFILSCKGFYFESFAAQSVPCFGTIHDEGCNSSLSDVFDPPDRRSNLGTPETKLFLFTNKNQDKAEPLHKCGGKLPQESDFDPNADTVILVNGFSDGPCRSAWMREMRNQFFKRGQYNVILVDWTWGNNFDLNAAGHNTIPTGQQIAFVLINIMNEKKMDGSKFHAIGHSLGSYVVAYIGKSIIKMDKSKKLRRITHLDSPALFLKTLSDERNVSPNDAQFVDAYHTNAGPCFPLNIGNDQNVGHVDFYPNGGTVQTSCYSYIFDSFLKGDILWGVYGMLFPQLCYHLQAVHFFKMSINHPEGQYIGVRCENYEDFLSGKCKRCCRDDFSNCAYAGMDAEYRYTPSKRNGNNTKYFFTTTDQCPYPEDYDFSINKHCKQGAIPEVDC